MLSVLQDSMGRIATILFAHKLGTSLEPECKMYRLAADIFNDTAMILNCLSPALPKVSRVVLLSFSSVLRALCGVCAGSSKASLSAHFARWGNLGELNAVRAFYAKKPDASVYALECFQVHKLHTSSLVTDQLPYNTKFEKGIALIISYRKILARRLSYLSWACW